MPNNAWIKNPETDIEKFINNFMGGNFANPDTQEKLRQKFRAGYCWHFAHILKDTFNRGKVCWTAPFGHMVFLDSDNRAYDIEGKYIEKDHECFYLIPESYLGKFINEFTHTKEDFMPVSTKQDLINIVKKYCNDNHIEYHKDIEDYFCNE